MIRQFTIISWEMAFSPLFHFATRPNKRLFHAQSLLTAKSHGQRPWKCRCSSVEKCLVFFCGEATVTTRQHGLFHQILTKPDHTQKLRSSAKSLDHYRNNVDGDCWKSRWSPAPFFFSEQNSENERRCDRVCAWNPEFPQILRPLCGLSFLNVRAAFVPKRAPLTLARPTHSGETDRRELTPSRSTLPSHRPASQKFWRRISALQ